MRNRAFLCGSGAAPCRPDVSERAQVYRLRGGNKPGFVFHEFGLFLEEKSPLYFVLL